MIIHALIAATTLMMGVNAEPFSAVLLRQEIGDVALKQARAMDRSWELAQRDCAGLIRYAFRSAYLHHAPDRVREGLWLDGDGRRSAFANAESLLRHSFVLLGRDEKAHAELQTGDILAFRQAASGPDTWAAPYHLILVVRPTGADRHRPLIVYHTGNANDGVRAGSLRAFERDAPREWRPDDSNPSFLGFYRFKEFVR